MNDKFGSLVGSGGIRCFVIETIVLFSIGDQDKTSVHKGSVHHLLYLARSEYNLFFKIQWLVVEYAYGTN